jgi:hypothetical protein
MFPVSGQSESHAEIDIARILDGLYDGPIFVLGFSCRKDKVVHLKRDTHGIQVPDHPGVFGSVQIEMVEPFNAGIAEVYMDNRIVIRGLQFLAGRSEMIQEIIGFQIPRLEKAWQDEKTEVCRDERRKEQRGINLEVSSPIYDQS